MEKQDYMSVFNQDVMVDFDVCFEPELIQIGTLDLRFYNNITKIDIKSYSHNLFFAIE